MSCYNKDILIIREITKNSNDDTIMVLEKSNYMFNYNVHQSKLYRIKIFKGSRLLGDYISLLDVKNAINKEIEKCEEIPEWEDKLDETD